MDPVRAQYEAYPYPARDPDDEAKRLITGSPSYPAEVDHMLFGGKRDWSKPIRALFAGGGTGDGLIMFAQKLAERGAPADILYLDMSAHSRRVAEARAAARGLTSITFETGDLLTAPERGPFDYIDCTGVLHHLPDPQAGFNALGAALAPTGGLGGMVYAPYGRTGVYPLQEALRALTEGEDPATQVAMAKAALKSLPKTNWFGRNPHLGDHEESDAGLYDLLLHSRDRPYTAEEVAEALSGAGLNLVSFLNPGLYDPARYLPAALHDRLKDMGPIARAGLAERLAGNLKAHVFYAARTERKPAGPAPDARPRLNGLPADALGKQIEKRGEIRIDLIGQKYTAQIPKAAGRAVALADGRRRLGEMAQALGLDWIGFQALWRPAHDALTGFNLLRYSEQLA